MGLETVTLTDEGLKNIKKSKSYGFIYDWEGRKIFFENNDNTPFEEFKKFAERAASCMPLCKYVGYLTKN